MDRFNFSILRQFWAIAKTYWASEEKWQARGLLLSVILLLLGYTGLGVVLNNKRGVLISALSAQDESRFWQTVLIFVVILVIYAPLLAGYTYLRDRLGLQWRRWLTHRFVDRYLPIPDQEHHHDRPYYMLQILDTEIDNPDQRIAEDIRSFTHESLAFLLIIVESILSVIAFSSVLWGISRPLVLFLVLYAGLGTVVTTFVFGKPLVRLNFEQLRKEANLRFSLVRVRENAEAIAFYRGEERESDTVKQRFSEVFDNVKRLLIWELNLNVLTNTYEFIPFILPALVVAPAIFAGEIEVGKVSEAQGAFVRVFFSLNVIVARFQSLTTFGAGISRLYTFAQYLEKMEGDATSESESKAESSPETESSSETESESTPEQSFIQTSPAEHLVLENLTLQTPNQQRTLIEDLSLTLPEGEGLLVMGPSGCGKSSLLRAIAGLWRTGTGTILRPDLEKTLFLPQRPYMVLGTLRDQLLYPNTHLEVDDAQLKDALKQVNLEGLDEQFGGFDAEQDWADVLSLGEQQRLTFARLLLNKPAYALLDEATSALDAKNEEHLYGQLQSMGTTFLSVGHRPTLKPYHQRLLEFSTNQTWQITEPVDTAIACE